MAHAHTLNELDPHGGTPHEHHVTSAFMLKFILGLLLLFTILTVGQAQAEQWIAHTFAITLPHWLNVVVVMGIATVKATLVLLYFMHLRHDNPINSIIFGFTVLGVFLFMSLTFLDIGNRGYIEDIKAKPAVWGGSGAGLDVKRPYPEYAGFTGSMTAYAGVSPYIGAVDARYLEIEAKYLPKYHPALMEPLVPALVAKPTDAMAEMIANELKNNKREMSIEEAARRIAFSETYPKAAELAAPEVRADYIKEFEYHLHHGRVPHADVMKRLEQKLGPAAFAQVAALAKAHAEASEEHGLRGDDDQSTKNFSRARKGRTSDLFEKSEPKVESGHGAH
jgi:cytochrome c oxidase subunit IV